MPSYKASLIQRLEAFRQKALALLASSCINPPQEYCRWYFGPQQEWTELSPEAHVLQASLYNAYLKLTELGKAFLAEKALPQAKTLFSGECERILELIKQEHSTWYDNIEKAKSALNEGLDKQIKAVNSMCGELGSGVILIPDTNVIIHSPHFHNYKVDKKSTILLHPTIAKELDNLKVSHGNENVRTKSGRPLKS